MNTNRELFEEAPVPKAVALMAVPTMIPFAMPEIIWSGS